MRENYLSTNDAAKLLGVTLPTIRAWMNSGRLQGWTTEGGHRRISRQSVMDALEEKAKRESSLLMEYKLPILVVEDDANLAKLYRHQISNWPVATQIYIADNGYEALVMVGEVHPRLVICDLRLPGVNGFGIVRGLCAIPRFEDISIVVVSGLDIAEINAHGALPPRVQIMGKPVDFEVLKNIGIRLWQESPLQLSETKFR